MEIHQVFGKAKDAALEVGAAGNRIEVYLAPVSTVQLLMGVNEQLKGGDLILAVVVGIVEHVVKPILGQINGRYIGQSDGSVHDDVSVLIINILPVKADGQVHVARNVCLVGKGHDGHHGCDHQNCNEHCQRFRGQSFCIYKSMVFHNTIPFLFRLFCRGAEVRRAYFLLSRYPAKQKERAGKVPQSTAASEHTLLSKDVFHICVRTGLRLMLTAEPWANTEMGVVSDSYRIS